MSVVNYGDLDGGGIVTNVIIADDEFIATLPGTWMALPIGVGIDWTFIDPDWFDPEGSQYVPPPAPSAKYRYILSGPEWVQRFTDDEWSWMKAKRADGTAGGKQLDKLMDAVRWTNSVDVSSPNMDVFYNSLVANGIPGGQTRVDVLREGILVE